VTPVGHDRRVTVCRQAIFHLVSVNELSSTKCVAQFISILRCDLFCSNYLVDLLSF